LSRIFRILSNISVLIAIVLLFQSCGGKRADQQSFVDNYLDVIKELKNPERLDIVNREKQAIIAYRKSGLTDVENAERAKRSLLDGIRLDSISLQRIRALKCPDPKAEEITNDLMNGISTVIMGDIIFVSNYSKAKDQSIQERKETIINVKPGMQHIAEGLNSVIVSMGNLQEYIKANNLKGTENITHWYSIYKMDSDNLRGFLKR
jgi:hypothetical protein